MSIIIYAYGEVVMGGGTFIETIEFNSGRKKH